MTTPMHLTHCTLTGVDEITDMQELIDLSVKHPIAEWGFLYSPKRQGQPGRYPSIAMLSKSFSELPAHVRVALHVCGQGVPDLLAGESTVSRLVSMVGERGGRVQLNFNQAREPIDLDALSVFLKVNPALQFITQHNDANSHVWPALQGAGNHAVLFDSSGGRGILAGQWPQALNGVSCGYAGGLCPANIATEFRKIHAVTAGAPFWIDMEGKLRDSKDWFDLGACQAVLESVPHAQKRRSPKVYPVIHYIDRETAFSEAQKAIDVGADGIFLINHHGDDMELLSVACAVQIKHPQLPVGVNFLSMSGLDAVVIARKFGLPMVWGDDVGVDSRGFTGNGLNIQAQKLAGGNDFEVFASVAFKYRPHEPNPELAATNALAAGFIPTTSGSGTGSAPELEKIIAMSKAAGGALAVASGMTPENVSAFAPYLSQILVATGVSIDDHRMDVDKLKRLIVNAKNPESTQNYR